MGYIYMFLSKMMKFLGKGGKMSEVSVDTCLIVDTITLTELYIEY